MISGIPSPLCAAVRRHGKQSSSWLQFVVLHASRQRLYLKIKQKAAEEHGCSRREWKELPTRRPALPPLWDALLTARAASELPGSGKNPNAK